MTIQTFHSKATDKQLWTILKSDKDCPLPLLEGVFLEALNRGIIKNFVLSVIKKKFGGVLLAQQVFKTTFEDLVQMGLEGSLKAIKCFKPGHTVFASFLFTTIYQYYVAEIRKIEAEKRQIEESSYHALTDEDGETLEYYLIDTRTNVEKTVINKIDLEEKVSKLNPTQRETLSLIFKGYSLSEIAGMMGIKKSAVSRRLSRIFILMTGHDINLVKLGIFERVSFKKQGA